MKKQMHVFFTGMVQGVGFRFATDRIARQFEVGGYVRNLANGMVELVAEGEEVELQEFLSTIKDSQLQPYIKETQVTWKDCENRFQSFTILA